MTGYGVPSTQPPAAPARTGQLFAVIGAGLGVLSFIWGFLDWYGVSGGGNAKGYAIGSPGPAAIGLSVLAGALAAIVLIDRSARTTLIPAAAAVASLLVSIGLITSEGDDYDVKIGLILQLVTAVVQAGVLIAGWLQAQGQLVIGGGGGTDRSWAAAQQPGPQQQYGYPGYGPPPGYPPPAGYPQSGGYPPPSGYGQQPGYGQQQPGYGQPGGYGQPAPAQPPYLPTQQPGYAQPQSPYAPSQPQQPPRPPGYGAPSPPPRVEPPGVAPPRVEPSQTGTAEPGRGQPPTDPDDQRPS